MSEVPSNRPMTPAEWAVHRQESDRAWRRLERAFNVIFAFWLAAFVVWVVVLVIWLVAFHNYVSHPHYYVVTVPPRPA